MSKKFAEQIATNRRGRECALQVLFELDGFSAEAASAAVEDTLARYWTHLDPETAADTPAREYAERVVRRVTVNRPLIDEAVQSKLQNWRLDRIGRVDRSILRLATYELLFAKLQTRIAVTQAAELGKKYGAEESGAFVNAVLDRVSTLRKSGWTP